jgi:large subunit ribosomal protein L17
MSNHNNGKSKLNLRDDHRKSLLRNQIISFINNGKLVTTKARVREVKRLVEKLVTVAREGKNFNVIRKLIQAIPYDKSAVYKLIEDIAPRYIDRPGGYTRCLSLGTRVSDTAPIAMLTWV